MARPISVLRESAWAYSLASGFIQSPAKSSGHQGPRISAVPGQFLRKFLSLPRGADAVQAGILEQLSKEDTAALMIAMSMSSGRSDLR
jgi:hypothetical protein